MLQFQVVHGMHSISLNLEVLATCLSRFLSLEERACLVFNFRNWTNCLKQFEIRWIFLLGWKRYLDVGYNEWLDSLRWVFWFYFCEGYGQLWILTSTIFFFWLYYLYRNRVSWFDQRFCFIHG